jgi:two-component system, NarL family, nitrate/nitrite response regulator NarL
VKNKISLAVVDDHPLFREGVARSLSENEEFQVVGEGGSKDDAVRLVRDLRPDVLLLDISMPGGGLEAIPFILEQVPSQKIIILTVSESSDDLSAALAGGAKGYALKGVGSKALAEIVRSVASGESYVNPSLSARVLSKSLASSSAEKPAIDQLTSREREVLELVAEGLSNKMIALRLDLMEKTVKHHMTQILSKLNISNRTEAALAWRDALEIAGR